jgi:hypothetical protein
MPVTVRQALGQVREYIGLPDNGKVSYSSIITKMNNESNTMLAELNITRDNESFKTKVMTINPLQSTYTVTADNWGKPFYVETYDGGADPLFQPNEITITPIQNREAFRATDVFTVSFYSDEGQPKMVITPPQEQLSWIKVYYEVESYVLAFNDSSVPLRDSYMHLLVIRTARACMPMTGHDEVAYGRLMGFLDTKEPQLNQLWLQQRQAQAAHSSERGYFGADREGYEETFWLG